MNLQFENVTVQHAGTAKPLFENLQIQVESGKIHVLLGPIGSGKSSLLQVVAGLLPIQSGSLWMNNRPLENEHDEEWLKKFALVFQSPEESMMASTLAKEFVISHSPFAKTPPSSEEMAYALSKQGLPTLLLQQTPLSLSGGQKRRAAVAVETSVPAEWLLCDEPTVGLDGESLKKLIETLQNWKLEHPEGGVLIATHQIDAFLSVADQFLLLAEGGDIRQCHLSELFLHPEWLEEIGIEIPTVLRLQSQWISEGRDVPNTRLLSAEEVANFLMEGWTVRKPHSENELMENQHRRNVLREIEEPNSKTQRRTHIDLRILWIGTWFVTLGCLFTHDWAGTLLSLAIAVSSIFLLGASPVSVLRQMRALFYLSVITLLFAGLSLHFHPYLNLGFHPVSMLQALQTSIRLLAAVALGLIVPFTTSEAELQQALASILQPLSKLRVPTAALSFATAYVLRFLPHIQEEWHRFQIIHLARFKKRLSFWRLPYIFVPFLLVLLQMAEDTSDALHAKGMVHLRDITVHPSPWKLKRSDIFWLLTASSLTVCLFLL